MRRRHTEGVTQLGTEANPLHVKPLSSFSQTGLPKSDCAYAAGANAGIMSAIPRPMVAMPSEIIKREPIFDSVSGSGHVTARERRRPARMMSLQPQIVGSDLAGHPHQQLSALSRLDRRLSP